MRVPLDDVAAGLQPTSYSALESWQSPPPVAGTRHPLWSMRPVTKPRRRLARPICFQKLKTAPAGSTAPCNRRTACRKFCTLPSW
jgi:hypothetical protein